MVGSCVGEVRHTSTNDVSAGSNPTSAYTFLINVSWVSALGTSKPLLFPSLFVAAPRIIALIGFPSRSASSRRLTYKPEIPSARANPSAFASNVLQEPSGESTPSEVIAAEVAGPIIKFVPATMAPVASPAHRSLQAFCSATRDAEQAVLTT